MPLDVHAHQHQHQHQHQLPALSQPGYAAHGVPGSHPAMVLPPPSVYNDHQYAQHASQEQVQTPTTPAQETAKPMPTVDQLNATAKALEPICGKQGPWTFRCVSCGCETRRPLRLGRGHLAFAPWPCRSLTRRPRTGWMSCNNQSAPGCAVSETRYQASRPLPPRRAGSLCRLSTDAVKDRRPITPPPCIRLVITDSQTGKEVDCKYVPPRRSPPRSPR